MDARKRFQRKNSYWNITIDGRVIIREWGQSWTPGRKISKQYPSSQQALAARERYIKNKVSKGYYPFPHYSNRAHKKSIRKAMDVFPLLDRNNIICAEIDSVGRVKGLHLERINTFIIRKALLNKKSFKYFRKLEWLRVGDTSIWLYHKDNDYKDNLQKIFPGTTMEGDAFELIFLLDYLDSTNVLGGFVREDLLRTMDYIPCGLLDMIAHPPPTVDRKTVINCNGWKSWVHPPEYFPVISRGYDGCTLGLMIDDGKRFRGLIESCSGGYNERDSLLLEFYRSLQQRKENSEFIHLYNNKEFVEEGRYSRKGYIYEECYSEEFCSLVKLLTDTLLAESDITPSTSGREDVYVFNYEDPSRGWYLYTELFIKGSSDRYGELGVLIDPIAYSSLPDNVKEEDVSLYYLDDMFGYSDGYILRKLRKNKKYRDAVFTKLNRLEELAVKGYPEHAFIWCWRAWELQSFWFRDVEHRKKIKKVLATSYRAMNRNFLEEIVNTIECAS